MKILGVIPARLKSERFPNKLLQDVNGVPLIKRIIQNANKLNVDKVVVATDSKKLGDFIHTLKNVDVDTIIIDEPVCCGTERLKYTKERYEGYNYYISIPADEPYINIEQINKYIEYIKENKLQYNIMTFYSKFYSMDRLKSNLSCKIVIDRFNNILYFSRSIIPINKDGTISDISIYKKHLGIFIFNRKILDKNIWDNAPLGITEGLEQNLFLENGYNIYGLKIDHPYYGIDTEKQIKELEELYDKYK